MMTGMAPTNKRMVYVFLAPILSQSQPISSRAKIVAEIEAMMMLPICGFVKCKSSFITFIMGARPNQAKKQKKNVIHVMWKVRICGALKLNRFIFCAFPVVVGVINLWLRFI